MEGGEIMFDENQLIRIRWNSSNSEWYQSQGYTYTKHGEYFYVKAKHLSPHSSAKIKVHCDYCGNEYSTQYALITTGRKVISKDCCSHCVGKKASDVSLKKRALKSITLAKEICEANGYELITTVDEYVDIKMPIKFRCSKHGIQTMSLDNLLHGHKCIKCSYEIRADSKRFSNDYIKSEIESINNNKWLNSSEYKDVFTHNLRIQCGLCGREFSTSFANYIKHDINRCSSCSQKESKGELKIRKLLDEYGIEYTQEKRFADCKDKKPLPFDFYLPKSNLIIEFDGKHHYTPVRGEENYQKTVNHDKIKNEYCIQNNIKLLRIPYWDINSINTIILNKLNL